MFIFSAFCVQILCLAKMILDFKKLFLCFEKLFLEKNFSILCFNFRSLRMLIFSFIKSVLMSDNLGIV